MPAEKTDGWGRGLYHVTTRRTRLELTKETPVCDVILGGRCLETGEVPRSGRGGGHSVTSDARGGR